MYNTIQYALRIENHFVRHCEAHPFAPKQSQLTIVEIAASCLHLVHHLSLAAQGMARHSSQ